MCAAILPLVPRPGELLPKHTRKQIAAVLREQFPKVSRSQCEKAASEAVAYCHVRPDADVGRANSTVLDAIANIQAGVA